MSNINYFNSVLDSRLKSLEKSFNKTISNLTIYCNNKKNNILRANIRYNYKNYYINRLREYFNTEYSKIKTKYDSDILNVKNEHKLTEELFRNSQEKIPEKTSVETPENLSNKHNKKALLIGCNYTQTEYKLRGCINDVNNIKDRLETKYGFEDIVVMTDKTNVKPYKKNIIEELEKLLNNNNPGDILFFSFSGHGTNMTDYNGDEIDGKDEMLVPLDMDCISDDEIKTIIQTHLKKDVTLFALIDCCHSGSILDLRYQYTNNNSENTISTNIGNYETIGNVIMISGCMDKQTSADAYINDTFQGAMSWSFLQATKNLSQISWRDLINNMRNLLEKSKYSQIPMLSSGCELNLDNNVCIM